MQEEHAMANQNQAQVVGENGLRGIVLGPSERSPNEIAIALDDGREISVPPSALTLQPGGQWFLHTGSAPDGNVVVPVISEELNIGKRKRPTGKVRVEKKSVAHDETVSMPLTRESADVQRVMINRRVDGPVPVRREGDTIIMPVVEEVAVVEKRLMLKEEIRITRRRTTQQHAETVTLHTEQADVQRLDPAGNPRAAASVQPAILPEESRSLVDPTKPRPSLLRRGGKPASSSRKSLLNKT
jgi:uncharacterized protein (TIGR02271 family)